MKKILMFVCLLALCNLTLFAQTPKSSRMVHATGKSAIHVPPQEAPEALKKIYSNLGESKTDLYIDHAWLVDGPAADGGYSSFIAMVFTPKSNSHVSQVQVAMQYLGYGANQVNLSIYGDSGGVPGTLLAGPVTVTNLPDFGTCCLLAVANFTPVAVTGGTQYWVVADTPATGTGSDFAGAWAVVVQGKVPPLATYEGPYGWSESPALDTPAGEVLGTIP